MKDEKDEAASDQDLLREAQASPETREGRQAACALLSRYRDRVYAWCVRHLGDEERALDVSQDVLINAYRNLGAFRRQAQFSSWLYAIVRNRCISELRRPHLLIDGGTEMDRVPSAERNPAEILVEKMDEASVLELIRSELDPLEQEVIWLRCFERMPIPIITETLRIEQTSGARGVLQRARQRLRAALDRRDRQTAEVTP